MGALELLGPAARFETSIRASAPPVDGSVTDLVLVGGGDPTLRRTGPHSLAALARQVRDRGVTSVHGSLVVDESRYDHRRDADGWLDWQRPTYVGSLSAVVVDGNRYRSDAAFLADPALAAAEELGRQLRVNGVSVDGASVYGTAPGDAVAVATLESEPVSVLVDRMLMRSDNTIAESLVKEIEAVRGRQGTTNGGLALIRHALSNACMPVEGVDADGSGLSRRNARSAREWRKLLEAARDASWGQSLRQALPLAGRSGTLAGRLTGPATIGNVRAKTGSIIPGRALSGYLTTTSGREATFSIVVNGDRVGPAQGAIDALVATVAASRA
jgi:D-alanyl-D-alanine carboxypeptidase/D-alanyl-D-alanine-endopeptidase (penicillin-binding protein 4)